MAQMVDYKGELIRIHEGNIEFSENEGITWEKRSEAHYNGDSFTDLVNNGNELLAFTESGEACFSKDYGQTWTLR